MISCLLLGMILATGKQSILKNGLKSLEIFVNKSKGSVMNENRKNRIIKIKTT